MNRLARVRKAIATALGMAITLILLVPEENIPERWRPVVGIVLFAGTVFGVYKVRNDASPVSRHGPVIHDELGGYPPTRAARPEDRRPFDGP